MMAAGAKLMALLPLAIVGLKMLVLKALVVSKIALFLALMLSASKLMGGGGGFGSGLLGKVCIYLFNINSIIYSILRVFFIDEYISLLHKLEITFLIKRVHVLRITNFIIF